MDGVRKNGLKAETVPHVEKLSGSEKIGTEARSLPQHKLSVSEQAFLELEKSCGCSQAAKCPPLSTSLK